MNEYLKIAAIILTSLSPSRSSRSEVFLRKDVLKICSKPTGERSCRSAISIKLQSKGLLQEKTHAEVRFQ